MPSGSSILVRPKFDSERRQQRSEIAGDEIGVFEDAEHQKIARDRDAERPLAAELGPFGR